MEIKGKVGIINRFLRWVIGEINSNVLIIIGNLRGVGRRKIFFGLLFEVF